MIFSKQLNKRALSYYRQCSFKPLSVIQLPKICSFHHVPYIFYALTFLRNSIFDFIEGCMDKVWFWDMKLFYNFEVWHFKLRTQGILERYLACTRNYGMKSFTSLFTLHVALLRVDLHVWYIVFLPFMISILFQNLETNVYGDFLWNGTV